MSFSLTFFKCVVEFRNQTLNSVVIIVEINSIQLSYQIELEIFTFQLQQSYSVTLK